MDSDLILNFGVPKELKAAKFGQFRDLRVVVTLVETHLVAQRHDVLILDPVIDFLLIFAKAILPTVTSLK